MTLPQCYFAGEKLTEDELEETLPSICDTETTFDIPGWSKENPLWGHCGVVTTLAHDLLGGKIYEGWLKGTTREETMEYLFEGGGEPDTEYLLHLWNELPGEIKKDFTAQQFGNDYPDLEGLPVSRKYVLSFEPTVQRYRTLAWRLFAKRFNDLPLTRDPFYVACFKESLQSDCDSMRFGSVVTLGDEIVATGTNVRNDLLKCCCEPECIYKRQKTTFNSPWGCDHAEEVALWNLLNDETVPKNDHKQCDIYIAGFGMDHRPWLKEDAVHTSLRCAMQMHRAGIRTILVPLQGGWGRLTTEDAVASAKEYAQMEEHNPY